MARGVSGVRAFRILRDRVPRRVQAEAPTCDDSISRRPHEGGVEGSLGENLAGSDLGSLGAVRDVHYMRSQTSVRS